MAFTCSTGNPIEDGIKGFFDFLGDPIGTIVRGIANAVLSGAISVFGSLTTNIPTLASADTARAVDDQTQGVVVYLAVGSLLFAAARMALERRGDAGRTALKGVIRMILVAGAATTVVTTAARLSDRYADDLFARGAQNQLNNFGCQSDIESTLLLVLAFLLLIAGIVQTILLFIRLGVMVILLGTLPLAASASMTDWGGGWWRKHIGWMTAWLLYKPAAGLVLFAGTAIFNAGDKNNDINQRIAGIGVMLLSAIALPALLKLVVPATAALGTGNPMATAMSTAGSLASGARSVGGGGGPAGQSGPSGAAGTGGGSGAEGPSGTAGSGGAAGSSGAAGSTGSGGAAGGAGSAGGAGAAGAGAAAAAGPAAAAVAAAQFVGKVASGAIEGADGDRGHNT
ncbi:hypothetical protein ACQEWB_22255 [Streptomyces sp. CA-249302]|uniref:hypothetical protein n=1 Tax=Streptomyces sp. CA-249302 TaxID=3240058 RepID=UPI003D8A2EA8